MVRHVGERPVVDLSPLLRGRHRDAEHPCQDIGRFPGPRQVAGDESIDSRTFTLQSVGEEEDLALSEVIQRVMRPPPSETFLVVSMPD